MPARCSQPRRSRVAVTVVLLALLASLCAPLSASAAGPKVSSPAAILVEPATGDIVYSRNADQQRAIASTTKMMTALVVLAKADLNDTLVTVPYDGLAVESTAGFRGGERVKVRDLLRALLVASANDAAQTLAVRIGGSRQRFVALMNARARRIGLSDTHFTTPIGLDLPGNYSSATDLVKMALLLRTNAFARATMDKPKVTLQSGAKPRTLKNRNTLIGAVPWISGVKTGHTQLAGYVLVGSASRRGVTLVSAVLGAGSEGARNADTLALMRYGFRLYESVVAVQGRKVYAKTKVKGSDQTVELVAAATVTRSVRKGKRITTRAVVPAALVGPIATGSEVGTLNLIYEGRVVDRVPLVTTAPIAASAAGGGNDSFVGRGIAGLIVALIAGTICLVLLRRRVARRHRQGAAADSEAGIA